MTKAPETTLPFESRIAELEIETAYQRETIDGLNQAVTEQWKKIEQLSKMLEQVLDHMRDQAPGADSDGGGDEPPPPHY